MLLLLLLLVVVVVVAVVVVVVVVGSSSSSSSSSSSILPTPGEGPPPARGRRSPAHRGRPAGLISLMIYYAQSAYEEFGFPRV